MTISAQMTVCLYGQSMRLSYLAKLFWLPLQITSGINAIAHAIEALWAAEANPIISNLALQGIEAVGKSIPLIRIDSTDRDSRSNALFGAWACGTCLGAVGMSLHHKLVGV